MMSFITSVHIAFASETTKADVGVSSGVTMSRRMDGIMIVPMTRMNRLVYPASIKPLEEEPLLLFDIDGCLYDSEECKLQREERAFFAREYMRLVRDDVYLDFRDEYKKAPQGHQQRIFCGDDVGLSREEFLDLHYSFDFREHLKEDLELRNILKGTKIRKWCFTNSPPRRALIVLDALGIKDCFEGIICNDVDAPDFIIKPWKEAYGFVMEVLGINNPDNVYFFDDAYANVVGAEEFGWKHSYHITNSNKIKDVLSDVIKSIQSNDTMER